MTHDLTAMKSAKEDNDSPSSLPRPVFDNCENVLSTKKSRSTPARHRGRLPPPRPQPLWKSVPVSRVFRRRPKEQGAKPVSFVQTPDNAKGPTESPLYDRTKALSYFEQAFVIEGKVGAGHFGTVLRARSKEDGKLYAVKVANEVYRGVTDRAQKLDEVRKHQFLLPHPNCVHFFQSWEENGRLYQQFELCAQSLDDYAEKRHDIDEKTIWAFLVDLLMGLEHLHDHNLIHLDVKPENIFIGFDGTVKLGDFGLMVDLTKDSKAIGQSQGGGDSRYLAKEVLQGHITKAADIFSLGISILELACDLVLPSSGHLWHQLRWTGADPEVTARLSPELIRVIKLMMAPDFTRRPTVKHLLALPSVQKASVRRSRELTMHKIVSTAEELPRSIFNVLLFLFTILIASPLRFVMRWIKGDQLEIATTPSRMIGQNYVPQDQTPKAQCSSKTPERSLANKSEACNLSSDEDDSSSKLSSSISTIARPLCEDSSSPSQKPEFNLRAFLGLNRPPSPIASPFGPQDRLLLGNQAQSTPSGILRRQQLRKRGANIKKLVFEDDDDDDSAIGRSSSVRKKPLLDSDLLNDESRRPDVAKVRPVSLSSRFELFSDDDNDENK